MFEREHGGERINFLYKFWRSEEYEKHLDWIFMDVLIYDAPFKTPHFLPILLNFRLVPQFEFYSDQSRSLFLSLPPAACDLWIGCCGHVRHSRKFLNCKFHRNLTVFDLWQVFAHTPSATAENMKINHICRYIEGSSDGRPIQITPSFDWLRSPSLLYV